MYMSTENILSHMKDSLEKCIELGGCVEEDNPNEKAFLFKYVLSWTGTVEAYGRRWQTAKVGEDGR